VLTNDGAAPVGVRTSLRVWEPPDTAPGPLLVLVHGSMDRQSGFRKLAKSLSQRYRVVTFDRRGYAASAHVNGPFSMEYQVRDLYEIVAQQPCVVVGHSFGGAVALAFAARYPELVRGVVVYESPMSWEPWWAQDSGGARVVSMAADPEQAAEVFLRRFIGDRLWSRLPQATRLARRAEGFALVGELSDIRSHPAWRAAEIKVPVMSGFGSKARDYVRRGAEVIGSLPDARLVEIEGAHHNAHSAEPELFEKMLVQPLLKRISSGSWDESVVSESD